MTMLNLASILEEPARRSPAKTAVVLGDTRLSYAQVNGAANQFAGFLRERGIGRGDKVALSCPNAPYFPIAYFGILKAGATVVPLNVMLKAREIAYHLGDADVKAHVVFEGTADIPMAAEAAKAWEESPLCATRVVITADPAAPSPLPGTPTLGQCLHGRPPVFETAATEPNDTAVILYTSGTTGMPKGAELTHSNLFCNAVLCRDLVGYNRDDVNLIVLPLFHSFGQSVQMNAGFLAGCTQVLAPKFDARAVLRLMHREKATIFCGVPTMYWAMMSIPTTSTFDPTDMLKTLRVCVSGGAALPLEVLKGFEQRFGAPILEGYGLSESSPVACFNQLDAPRKPGTIGTPVWGVQMRIAAPDGTVLPAGEPGEVQIRGHNIMKGYYKRPEETQAALVDGWLRTGDVGKVDEDGYYAIVDRLKDLIIRGGFNVYPRELEEVLLTHPAIAQAAVIGVPDPRWSEEVKAVVTLKPEQSITPDQLVAWCRDNMASYKYPRIVEIRDALPLGPTGKILKRALRGNG